LPDVDQYYEVVVQGAYDPEIESIDDILFKKAYLRARRSQKKQRV
jgi:hypothetical protein